MEKSNLSPEILKENLTELESFALQSLINGLYAEPHFSDIDANDISHSTKIPNKSLRGVLSSLIKKGYIFIDDYGSGANIPLIYLIIDKWYLHKEWKNSYEYTNHLKEMQNAEAIQL